MTIPRTVLDAAIAGSSTIFNVTLSAAKNTASAVATTAFGVTTSVYNLVSTLPRTVLDAAIDVTLVLSTAVYNSVPTLDTAHIISLGVLMGAAEASSSVRGILIHYNVIRFAVYALAGAAVAYCFVWYDFIESSVLTGVLVLTGAAYIAARSVVTAVRRDMRPVIVEGVFVYFMQSELSVSGSLKIIVGFSAYITANTVIDALQSVLKRADHYTVAIGALIGATYAVPDALTGALIGAVYTVAGTAARSMASTVARAAYSVASTVESELAHNAAYFLIGAAYTVSNALQTIVIKTLQVALPIAYYSIIIAGIGTMNAAIDTVTASASALIDGFVEASGIVVARAAYFILLWWLGLPIL